MLALYRELIELRRRHDLGALDDRPQRDVRCDEPTGVVVVRRSCGESDVVLALNLSGATVDARVREIYRVELDTAAAKWGGPGDNEAATTLAPWSAKLLVGEKHR
jgi:hypothetical protein